MHQAAVSLLAVPVFIAIYVGTLVRRSVMARAGLALGLAIALGIGVIGAGEPALITATPVSPILPLAQAEFSTTFSTDRGLATPVTIKFSTAMDPGSVAAALAVDPPTQVDLSWNASGTTVTIAPRGRWSVGTLHTITVQAGALTRSGQPLMRPARAAFLTRDATTASIVATDRIGTRVSVSTSFLVSFARPVVPATVLTAVRLDPPAAGTIEASDPTEGPTHYLFVPAAPLQPDVAYHFVVSGVRDLDGLVLDPVSLAIQTTTAPTVVRFRPRDTTQDVARDAAISIRFTEAMDRVSTTRAFTATAGGKAVTGTVSWAESDTVLIFTPSASLPFGTTVAMDVSADAKSTTGVRLGAPGHGIFQTIKTPVAPKPTAKPVVPKAAGGTGSGSGSGGGSTVGGGSWGAVETYYLGLMNCTRTGGWVTSSGSCSSPGGRNVAALKLD
ncbi:MAG: Ig-like domain-containing protein, partial [Acidimicrobiia bacterium]